MVKIKILSKDVCMPERASDGASGYDLRASIYSFKTIEPGERALIPTGIALEMEPGWEAQVRPRSGLAIKSGITVLNTPGTIDSDFRGEVCVILVNLSNKKYCVCAGERIAQLVFSKVEHPVFELVEEIDATTRGAGGFGSTGV